MKIADSRFLKCDFWLDMLFPNRCPCCGRIIKWDKLICGKCLDSLPFLDDTPWQVRFPSDVSGDDIFFDYAAAVFAYESPAVEGIYCLKSGHGVNFARFAADILCHKLENDGIAADIITCVPMAAGKKRSRGYNQAEILAKYISRKTDIPCDFRLLKRKAVSLEQHTLNAGERHSLAGRIYSLNGAHGDIKGKTVLLCDDVFTTGATMNKCAELLKGAGADKVFCVSICCTEKKLGGGE